jgi:hypothetical protein
LRRNPWRHRKTRAAIMRGIRRAASRRRQSRARSAEAKAALEAWGLELQRDEIMAAMAEMLETCQKPARNPV